MLHPGESGFYKYLLERSPSVLQQHVVTKKFAKGTKVYSPPQKLHHMYEVIKGAVQLGCYTDKGTELIYEILQPGDFFGNLHFLNGQFSEFSKCLIDVELRIYDLKYFKKQITHDPLVSEWFMARLTARWCRTETRLVELSSTEPRKRVRNLIQSVNRDVIDAQGRSVNLLSTLTFQELADLAGTTRQLVAQEVKASSNANYIESLFPTHDTEYE